MAVSKTRENYKKRLVGALYARCASLPSDVRGLGLAANGQAASTHAVPGSQRARCARQPARAVPGSQRALCQAASARAVPGRQPARALAGTQGRARDVPRQPPAVRARCLDSIGQARAAWQPSASKGAGPGSTSTHEMARKPPNLKFLRANLNFARTMYTS